MITYNIKIDLQSERTQYTNGEFTTGDVGAYRLCFSFYDNGKLYSASDCFLSIKAKRADGVIVTDLGTVTKEGEAYYDVKSDIYAVAGELFLEIALSTGDGGYITTKELVFRVREGYGDVGKSAGNHTPILAELLTLTNRSVVLANRAEETAKNAEELFQETRQHCANAITGHSVGENMVLLDEISPLAHKPEVKVTSLNHLNLDAMLNECLVKNEDGSYTMTRLENNRFSKAVDCFIPAGLIDQFMTVVSQNLTQLGIQILFWDIDGDNSYMSGGLPKDGTVRANGLSHDVVKMQLYLSNLEEVGASITFKDACIKSRSDTSKVYSPYVASCTLQSVNQSGEVVDTVEAFDRVPTTILSASPTTEVKADAEGIAIECVYNKDANKVIENINDNLAELDRVQSEHTTAMGDIETALDSIIAIQNELIGGDSV